MPMSNSTSTEKENPSCKTLAFLKLFARNYRSVKLPNGEFADLMLG